MNIYIYWRQKDDFKQHLYHGWLTKYYLNLCTLHIYLQFWTDPIYPLTNVYLEYSLLPIFLYYSDFTYFTGIHFKHKQKYLQQQFCLQTKILLLSGWGLFIWKQRIYFNTIMQDKQSCMEKEKSLNSRLNNCSSVIFIFCKHFKYLYFTDVIQWSKQELYFQVLHLAFKKHIVSS